MGKLKRFFKHKFLIIACSFILAGVIALTVMAFIPKAKTYTNKDTVEYEHMGEKVIYRLTFEDDKNYYIDYVNEKGKVVQEKAITGTYEIKDGVLYSAMGKWGTISVYGIDVKFAGVLDAGYECKPAKYARVISIGFIAIGIVMIVLFVYVAISKRKNRKTKYVQSNNQGMKPNEQYHSGASYIREIKNKSRIVQHNKPQPSILNNQDINYEESYNSQAENNINNQSFVNNEIVDETHHDMPRNEETYISENMEDMDIQNNIPNHPIKQNVVYDDYISAEPKLNDVQMIDVEVDIPNQNYQSEFNDETDNNSISQKDLFIDTNYRAEIPEQPKVVDEYDPMEDDPIKPDNNDY